MNRPTIVWAIVVAQFLVQVGAFTLPALLPFYIGEWHLSKTEAGWLIGVFFAAYVFAVPVLVSLTDRVPPRRVYMIGAALTAISHFGFVFVADNFWWGLVLRAIGGIGWAAAYMPGLNAIADVVQGDAQNRAVSMHAAGVGLAGASSFAIAGLLAGLFSPSVAFAFGGTCAVAALGIAFAVMPAEATVKADAPNKNALLDFRPVFHNRPAMGWIAGYTVHTLEMAAVRAWGVTFLTVAAAQSAAPSWLPAPSVIMTIAGFAGIAISILGNELTVSLGRLRIITLAFAGAAIIAAMTGWFVASSPILAAVLMTVWMALIFLDSSALTAGTVQAADPQRRGATMGLHSMCGYAGGFIGPLGVGVALDLAGDNIVLGWGLGFAHLAVITMLGFALLKWFARRPAQ